MAAQQVSEPLPAARNAPVNDFTIVSTRRARVLAAHVLAAGSTGVAGGRRIEDLYGELAAGHPAPHRSVAVRHRSVTLANAYVARCRPDGAAPEGVLVPDEDTGGVRLVGLTSVTFSDPVLAVSWAIEDGRVVDVLSGAPHGRALRQAARTGAGRRCAAIAAAGRLGSQVIVRVVAPSVHDGLIVVHAPAVVAEPGAAPAMPVPAELVDLAAAAAANAATAAASVAAERREAVA